MKILAIGGGEIGRPGTKVETKELDQEIIKLTGKKHPKLLFIPTASGDSESYYFYIQKHFGKRLGCRTDVLYLIKEKPTTAQIKNKILNSDIIYVGGGNTLRMLKIWRKLGVDLLLKQAARKNIVLSGISAGAVCWFKFANSDSMKFSNPKNPLIKLRGLNFIPLMCCPHYNTEKFRRPSLRKMVKQKGGVAIALDNSAAFEFVDGQYRVITSFSKANAYQVFRKSGKVIEEKLVKDLQFRPVKDLTK